VTDRLGLVHHRRLRTLRLGARVFRVHDVPATREALAAVADLRAAAIRER
jgi:dihydropteroate synthase